MRSRPSLILIVVVAFVSLPFTLLASDQSTRNLLMKAGFDHALQSVAEAVTGAADLSGIGGNSRVHDAWTGAAKEVFSPEIMMSAFVAHIRERLSADDTAILMAFFDSPLGRQVTRLENETYMAQADPLWQERSGLLLDRLNSKREALYQELIDALGGIDGGVAVAMNVNMAVMRGMRSGGMLPGTMSDAQLLSLVRDQQEAIRSQIARDYLAFCAHAYSKLSVDELQAYLVFLQTREASLLYDAFRSASESILPPMAGLFGERIGARLNEHAL